MNFIDKLKEELERETEELASELESYADAEEQLNSAPKNPRLEMTDEEVKKELTCMSRDVLNLANTWADSALIFYNKLKGKFTPNQILQMVEMFYTLMGGRK